MRHAQLFSYALSLSFSLSLSLSLILSASLFLRPEVYLRFVFITAASRCDGGVERLTTVTTERGGSSGR